MTDNVKQAVPFFGVRDMERSFHFYVDLLGFKKRWEWVPEGKLRWCWLERGGAALMLQESALEGPLGIGISINFICEDAVALYHEFRDKQGHHFDLAARGSSHRGRLSVTTCGSRI